MNSKTAKNNGLTLTLYQGDFKTLIAYSLDENNKKLRTDLAGFTISFLPHDNKSTKPYHIYNYLRFQNPSAHSQIATEPANSSINAPLHKFRWIHVPGSVHQGIEPFRGTYTYTVTPRYFNQGSLLPIDKSLSVSLDMDVVPFKRANFQLGFTRGFMQSQAYVRHFGPKALIRPKELLYDTSEVAGKDPQGNPFTYADEYKWLGFTAREIIFEWLDEVIGNSNLRIDVFAYDLNEPDVLKKMLQLAKEGRIRVILDNAALHHGSPPKREDQFEKEFKKVAKAGASIVRGKFGRYSHDKIFIVYDSNNPVRVLTGSTNLAVTGLYVNSNHIVVIKDSAVAQQYAKVFNDSMTLAQQGTAFAGTADAQKVFPFASAGIPKIDITYSPHTEADAKKFLGNLAARVEKESKIKDGSVLFAVMELDSSGAAVEALVNIHADQDIFSYGITDTTDGIQLYKPGTTSGVLVTGKPADTFLPPPFSQVPGVGIGHQVHHKFVVCGFNRDDAVVYCGSSNLALGGEKANGDNLLAIFDKDVATAFAIEALSLVDHFHFLDSAQGSAKTKKSAKIKTPSKTQLAAEAGWFLATSANWTKPYYDSKDLKCMDRVLFAGV